MLPFNVAVFITNYSSIIGNLTPQQLTMKWYDEVLTIGVKVLSIFRDNTPINPQTNSANTWNASTNTPFLQNSTGQAGISYLCIESGTPNFGAGYIPFNEYDIVSFNTTLKQWCNVGQPFQYYWATQILCHLCVLANRPVVGRLNNASEGDVSGSFSYQDTINSQWWNQTSYGAAIWQQLKKRGGFTAFAYNPYQGILYQGNNNVYN